MGEGGPAQVAPHGPRLRDMLERAVGRLVEGDYELVEQIEDLAGQLRDAVGEVAGRQGVVAQPRRVDALLRPDVAAGDGRAHGVLFGCDWSG